MSLLKKLGLSAALAAGLLAFASPEAKAQGLYIEATGGMFVASESSIQNVYGIFPQIKAGLGYDFDDGLGVEGYLSGVSKKGASLISQGIKFSPQLDELDAGIKVIYNFGKKGDGVRPYVGGEMFYDNLKETVTAISGGTGSATVTLGGLGFGAFAGLSIPLWNKYSLLIEADANSAVVANSATASPYIYNIDAGGFSVNIGVKATF